MHGIRPAPASAQQQCGVVCYQGTMSELTVMLAHQDTNHLPYYHQADAGPTLDRRWASGCWLGSALRCTNVVSLTGRVLVKSGRGGIPGESSARDDHLHHRDASLKYEHGKKSVKWSRPWKNASKSCRSCKDGAPTWQIRQEIALTMWYALVICLISDDATAQIKK